MKMTTKMSAILLGIVLGLDLSVLITNFRVVGPEDMIILYAIMVIVLDFWDNVWFRQVSRFCCALIIGIALREQWQLSMEICFIISVLTITGMVAIPTIKTLIKIAKMKRDGEEEIYDDMSDWDDDGYTDADYEEYDDDEEVDTDSEADTEVEADAKATTTPDESQEK